MNAPELIFHHYPNSPFSEKIRLVFGYKALAWRSVTIPSIMPKPDVVALTGGYRKTPILQVGADIYCDSALIARVLEARQPAPTLYPASQPLAPMLAHWADSVLFVCAVAWALQPAGIGAIMPGATPETFKAFGADRAAAGFRRMQFHDAAAQLRTHLAALDEQLLRGGPWLLGAEASIADFAVAHGLWFIRLAPPVAGILKLHPSLDAWLDRMAAIGHGHSATMSSGDAVAVAAAATGHAPTAVGDGLGFASGDAVSVAATDWASDAVSGTLVGLSADEAVLRRTDPRAGTVHVHFPRIGFQLKKETSA
jgi:glutathione S-transferase